MSGLTTRPAVELLEMLRRNSISPGELAAEHRRQIECWNPALRALVDFSPDRIAEQVSRLEDSPARRGPLYGLPVTVKSSISTEGHRCETGSLSRRGHRPDRDATTVDRLRRAGAIVLGTTNCPEFLMAYETDNLIYGRTANPWDLERTAGGSSGGESAAIAAGLSAAGLGSDGGGSVREPAHFTGICALKPTIGRIPAIGHLPPCEGPFGILGAIGPMARTVADLKLLFQVLSGPDPVDPAGAPVPLRSFSREEVRRIPIGYFEDDGLVPVTSETRRAVLGAVHTLEREGFRVRPYRPPSLEAARRVWWTFFVRCGAMLLDPLGHPPKAPLADPIAEALPPGAPRDPAPDRSPLLQEFLAIARREPPLSGGELLAAWAESDQVRSRLLAEMREFPVLLLPACSIPAFRHGERSWRIEGCKVEYLDAMRYTQWFNLLGGPAAVVPAGQSAEGLPIGVQIAGRPFEDEIVLEIAEAVERSFGYRAPNLADWPAS